jgi:hypothetical protein
VPCAALCKEKRGADSAVVTRQSPRRQLGESSQSPDCLVSPGESRDVECRKFVPVTAWSVPANKDTQVNVVSCLDVVLQYSLRWQQVQSAKTAVSPREK